MVQERESVKNANTNFKSMSDIKTAYEKVIRGKLMKAHGYTSPLAPPRLIKIVVNTGIGRVRDEKEIQTVEKYFSMIVGQKAHARPAKKSKSSFKSRQGMIIGFSATLRGRRMYDFLSRLINIALPRSRDFRGIPSSSVDESGNLSIGIKEHIAFPEIIGEDVKHIFGLEATLVVKARNREEALDLYREFGVPLKK